jgi:hypothetical protein
VPVGVTTSLPTTSGAYPVIEDLDFLLSGSSIKSIILLYNLRCIYLLHLIAPVLGVITVPRTNVDAITLNNCTTYTQVLLLSPLTRVDATPASNKASLAARCNIISRSNYNTGSSNQYSTTDAPVGTVTVLYRLLGLVRRPYYCR